MDGSRIGLAVLVVGKVSLGARVRLPVLLGRVDVANHREPRVGASEHPMGRRCRQEWAARVPVCIAGTGCTGDVWLAQRSEGRPELF